MNSAEDFLLLLLHAYIHVVEAGRVLQLQNPTNSVFKLARSIIDRFVRFPNMTNTQAAECDDGVYVYATKLLSLSLLFHDAIKEGVCDTKICIINTSSYYIFSYYIVTFRTNETIMIKK